MATKKSNNTIALEVLMDKYGSGEKRKRELTKRGYDYYAIQKIVNERMTKKPIDTVAKEVINGLWGNGNVRKKCLTVAKYNYNTVQNRVNEILHGDDKKHYSGVMPTLKLVKTTSQVIADAITFARWVVSDDRFGYGRKGGAQYKGTKDYKVTHHGGCHFCGSNDTKINLAKKYGLSNPNEWEYTYVCNTFVHACYAHAGVMPMLNARGHAWWIGDYQKSKNWEEIKKPSKITDCKPGDVFAWDTHFCLYLGNGKGAEATSNGNAASSKENWASSIRIGSFTNHFKKATHIFRYVGTVNSTTLIKYGEVSDRVGLLQDYLVWYGCDLSVDREFGDATLAAVKKFQKDQGLTVDGVVGTETLGAMAKVVK